MTQAVPPITNSKGPSAGRSARELVARGATLLDVRTEEEFRDEHLPGALNVPLQELTARVAEVGPRDRMVVVYCRSGRRSAEAALCLRQHGFVRVHDLGAMCAWGSER